MQADNAHHRGQGDVPESADNHWHAEHDGVSESGYETDDHAVAGLAPPEESCGERRGNEEEYDGQIERGDQGEIERLRDLRL